MYFKMKALCSLNSGVLDHAPLSAPAAGSAKTLYQPGDVKCIVLLLRGTFLRYVISCAVVLLVFVLEW